MSEQGCLRVGQIAPDFTATAVVDQEFKTLKLSDYRGKYVVLFFYPLDFTFVCPTEITAFSDHYSSFKDIKTEVLGVSIDSEFSHLAWSAFSWKSFCVVFGVRYTIAAIVTRQMTMRQCLLHKRNIIEIANEGRKEGRGPLLGVCLDEVVR